MNIKPLAEVLPLVGLQNPAFHALIADVQNYKVTLFQPTGEIEADANGVRNKNTKVAAAQYREFIEKICVNGSDLAVTPEYSLPWSVIMGALSDGRRPALGKLWALGCESIKYSELVDLRNRNAGIARFVFEDLQPDDTRFVDPLVYVFQTLDNAGVAHLVLLVQLKTHPMGDPDHFEVNNLQLGTQVYMLGGGGGGLRLLSIICSDAFAFTDQNAIDSYDRTLVIHIQLNNAPRHEQYRHYRDKLLKFTGDATELICLNWAGNVQEWTGEKCKYWHNFSASAWYLRPDKFDAGDNMLARNHSKGLYYTWLKPLRYHTLFFNEKPAVYEVIASKVAHVGVSAALSRRKGPQVSARFIWDDDLGAWEAGDHAEDGFLSISHNSGTAKSQIEALFLTSPLYLERLLALNVGEVTSNIEWHFPNNLDSFAIDATEIIHRMTFCQDGASSARDFRVGRLRLCARLKTIADVPSNLPSSLRSSAGQFSFDWTPAAPHQNIITKSGTRATLVYLGEQATQERADQVRTRLADYLRRSMGDDDSIQARQQLAVWYQDEGTLRLSETSQYSQLDKSTSKSEYDIGREW